MRKLKFVLLFILVLSIAVSLAACGGDSGGDSGASSSGPDAAAGEKLFDESLIGTQPGCKTCHSLEADVVMVGPSLAGVGGRLDEAGIRQSITEPDATVVEGFAVGTMPAALADELSDQQLNDIVAYLATLK